MSSAHIHDVYIHIHVGIHVCHAILLETLVLSARPTPAELPTRPDVRVRYTWYTSVDASALRPGCGALGMIRACSSEHC